MGRMFNFETNWKNFSEKVLDEGRIVDAVKSLQHLLQRESLEGLNFLDVGCGSGLFSIAAARIGAKQVVGLDINPGCIVVSEKNRLKFSAESQIKFLNESILNKDALNALGTFDLVYAWGSLHHTGAMWEAIRNTVETVADGGILVLAIYNKHITSPIWRFIKRGYNYSPTIIQKSLVIFFGSLIYLVKLLVTHQNPLKKQRGMDYWIDVVDWLGGYPYEYAESEKVIQFTTELGFEIVNFIPAEVPTGCNEFVFKRSDIPCV